MRFIASVIGGGIMDRYPNLRVGILECGFGWLPFWGRRMNEQYDYVGSTQKLKHHPEDYLKSGRFFCRSSGTRARTCSTPSPAFSATTC